VRRSSHFTATTHRQGRARIDFDDEDDDDDDDGNTGTTAGGSRAVGGDDIDWEGIQEEELVCWSFFFSSLFGALCQRGRKLEGSTTL